MPDYEQSVFISYAWGGEREDIVNEIDETLQQRGIRIVRDKRALGYRGSIKDFMERIGRGSCIIVVISDKYLRSPNCMFELVEIAENKQFHDRIFPVVLSDANIYDPLKRIEYIKFWEGKRKELAKAMKTLDPANLHGIREEMDQYDRIRDKISGITSILKDMNTLTPDMHRDSEFSNLYDAIIERLKESSTDVTTEFDEMAKKADREAEAERIARAEANRLAARKAEEERLAIAKAEEERKAKEEAKEERLAQARAETERKATEESDRLAAQKVEEDRIAQQKMEAERLAAQKTEAEHIAARKAEEGRRAKEEADRLAAQKAERERIEREKAEQERLALAKVEAEHKAQQEADRLAAQKAEAERLAKQKAEEERFVQAKAETGRKAKEEADRIAAQKAIPVGAKPVSAITTQKKPASRALVFGITGVVALAICGLGYGALSMLGAPSVTEEPIIPNSGTEAPVENLPAEAVLQENTPTEPPMAAELPTEAESANLSLGTTVLSASEAGKIIESGDFQGISAIAGEQHTEEELNGFLDNFQPIPVTLDNSLPTAVGVGWCATTQETLMDNLKHIEIVVGIDGELISEDKFAEMRFSETEDGIEWECLRKLVIIDVWTSGQHDVHQEFHMLEKINDGIDEYEPYTSETDYIVTVP